MHIEHRWAWALDNEIQLQSGNLYTHCSLSNYLVTIDLHLVKLVIGVFRTNYLPNTFATVHQGDIIKRRNQFQDWDGVLLSEESVTAGTFWPSDKK